MLSEFTIIWKCVHDGQLLAMSKRQPFFPGIYPVLLNNLHLMLSVMCFVCIYFATPYDIVSSKKNKPCENETTRDDLYFSDRSSLLIFESVIIKSLCHSLVKTNKIFQVFSEGAFQKK